MMILRPHEPLILPPVPKFQWRARSAAQAKDQFGNENQTRFRLRLRLNDGHVKWVGWFDDRDDFDAYLWAVVLQIDSGLPIPPALRNYVIEEYGDPEYWPGLQYDFATVSFLTSPTGSNQTWTSPADWDNATNTIEILASGGTGGVKTASTQSHYTSGGGGGEYRKLTNFSVATPGTTTATYNIAAAAAGASATQTGSTNVQTNGNAGTDTWWDGTTRAGSSLGAIAGGRGIPASGAGGAAGGAGGTGGNGGTGNAGGRGGTVTSSHTQPRATGAGGGGGPNGAGVNGVDIGATGTGVGTDGGAGDNGSGGAASAGVSQATGGSTPPSNSNNGNNGTEWDASHGVGGGSGACQGFWNPNAATRGSGNGGAYAAGSGGCLLRNLVAGTVAFSGSSGQGMIVVTYTPVVATKGYPFANINPMSVMLAR